MTKKSFNFIFVDESGDPGKPFEADSLGNKIPTGASRYYILTALCLDSQRLFHLEDKILEVKNKFKYKKEIKSNEVSLPLYKTLLNIINELKIKIYYRLIDKYRYKGTFAVKGRRNLHNVFDEYNLAKLVSLAIRKENYTEVKYVTHVNSEYVNAMQISDLISGTLKDFVTGRNKDLKRVINKNLLVKIY